MLVVVAAAAQSLWSGYEAAKHARSMEAWYRGKWGTDGCLGDATLIGRQVFLPETASNGSVAVPRRARDLDCYARTKYREFKLAGFRGGVRVALTVNGELQRLDPNTTIASRVVAPLAAISGTDVVVFLTLQSRRPKTVSHEWHSQRFQKMPVYDDAEERRVLGGVVARMIRAGAAAVDAHLYELVRRPPQMPSHFSGANPGKASVNRFQLVWPSYALHLLVHSLVWRDVERRERVEGREFDVLYKMRADAGWLGDAPIFFKQQQHQQEDDAVRVKSCLAWGGINDKFAVIPRRHAENWMRLLEAYYDDTLHGYKNSEEYQLLVAKRHNIPVKREPTKFPMLDYYWWLRAADGSRGCFPWNYAGIVVHHRHRVACTCLSAELCPRASAKLCAGPRPLGNS
ncbi:hypothetical protein CTAYLR_000899 [Chrysophaeum taylorii]|uniref:Uncharacterized protein n=1 Tax=Chrysophaeum taylorii TaxID=2483200 RepID=A0AAD7XQ23_9STRA|nr:hypothetical protein CTAYLR_000899 [Chrysophaeum taylorii]